MDYEIEFLPVGEGSRAGDAIIIRYGFPGNYRVMIVDGGTDDAGDEIVARIRVNFGAMTVVSDVVSTHPDTDHSCGLRAVLRELPVERFWAHGLWHHAPQMLDLFSGNWTADGLAIAIRREYPVMEQLFKLAAAQGAEIREPFAGETIGPFTVLSPSLPTYEHLIPQFRKTPTANVDLLKARGIWLGVEKGPAAAVAAGLRSVFEGLVSWVPEAWEYERLREEGVTAAENESSTVLFGAFDPGKVLLTADAGVNALSWAIHNANVLVLSIHPLDLVQVPHHGSRRNVSPSVLNGLIGPPIPYGSLPRFDAIASVPKDQSKHPRKMVINAFTRRGAAVGKTAGLYYRYNRGMPIRYGEVAAQAYPFFTQVEDYD